MLPDTALTRLDLRRDQFTCLTDARGTRIDCLDGSAWITVDNDTRDVVLSRGESFVVASPSRVIVHAILGPATVTLRARASACPRPRQGAWSTGWRGWVGSLVALADGAMHAGRAGRKFSPPRP